MLRQTTTIPKAQTGRKKSVPPNSLWISQPFDERERKRTNKSMATKAPPTQDIVIGSASLRMNPPTTAY
jgi:hypothetical protein